MFRLITTVRRGTASDLAAAWARYPSIEAARGGASALMREDRVLRVMVVRNDITRTIVEWSDRQSGIKGWNVKGVCRGKPLLELGYADANRRGAVHRGISAVARLQT